MILPKIYLITCDESQYIIPVTDYLINKYSNGLEVNYLGYTNPNYKLSNKSNFIELTNGNKRNINNWFSDLYNYFNSIDDEYVIFSVDDNPIVDYLDIESLEFAVNYMNNNKEIGILFGYNFEDNGNNILYEDNSYKIYYIDNNFYHKTCCQMNIWKRKTLMSVLSSNYNNLIQFETQSEFYLKNDRVVSMTIKNPKIKYYNNLFPACLYSLCSENRNKNYIFVLPIKKEDIEYLIKNNLLDINKINYNGSHSHVFPFNYFGNNFNYEKMREYVKINNWDENNLGWNYSIKIWEQTYPHHID